MPGPEGFEEPPDGQHGQREVDLPGGVRTAVQGRVKGTSGGNIRELWRGRGQNHNLVSESSRWLPRAALMAAPEVGSRRAQRKSGRRHRPLLPRRRRPPEAVRPCPLVAGTTLPRVEQQPHLWVEAN